MTFQVWGVDPSRLLMVGDSFEDVEVRERNQGVSNASLQKNSYQVGNAAGTATCLIAGGGNEKPGAVVVTPAGALATFKVNSLDQLKDMLEGRSKDLKLGWPARLAAGEPPVEEGRL